MCGAFTFFSFFHQCRSEQVWNITTGDETLFTSMPQKQAAVNCQYASETSSSQLSVCLRNKQQSTVSMPQKQAAGQSRSGTSRVTRLCLPVCLRNKQQSTVSMPQKQAAVNCQYASETSSSQLSVCLRNKQQVRAGLEHHHG